MKKITGLVLAFFVVGCTLTETLLNERFTGKEVFLCERSADGKARPGKKVVKSITCMRDNSNRCNVNLLNESGAYEVTSWSPKTNNYIEDMDINLISRPYCSSNGYKKYVLEKQRREEAKKIKEEKIKANVADCTQAFDNARKRILELGEDIEVFSNVLSVDTFNGDVNKKSGWLSYFSEKKVVDTTKNGIILSNDCSLFKNIGNVANKTWLWKGLLSAAGNLIGSLCKEEPIFIYNDNPSKYADKEIFSDNVSVYKRDGSFKYKNAQIKAYRKTEHKVSEIEHTTYLNNKKLKCCVQEGKIAICGD